MGLLIYKYEPFWQEVSVKSLILRWPLRPVGLLLMLLYNHMCLLIWTVFSGEPCGPWASCCELWIFFVSCKYFVWVVDILCTYCRFRCVSTVRSWWQTWRGSQPVVSSFTPHWELRPAEKQPPSPRQGRTASSLVTLVVVINHLIEENELSVIVTVLI